MRRLMEDLFDPRISERQAGKQQEKYRRDRLRLSKLSSEEAAKELNNKCPYCGELRIPIRREVTPTWETEPRIYWSFLKKHGCPQEAEALMRQEQEEKSLQWRLVQLKRKRIFETAGLVGRLEFATFQNFLPRIDWPEAMQIKQRIIAYCEAIIREDFSRPWLIFYGDYGTGKSHLAASIIHKAVEAGWSEVYFRVWPEYLRRLEATFSPGFEYQLDAETRSDITKGLGDGRLIVIDDLDKRRPTQFTRDELYEPLNRRYIKSLPTILTFNLDPTFEDEKAKLAIEEYIGPAILDRIFEVAFDLIDFDGPSFRGSQVFDER